MTLMVVSKCPSCGSPIYGPESMPIEYVKKIEIVRTCKCVPLDDAIEVRKNAENATCQKA